LTQQKKKKVRAGQEVAPSGPRALPRKTSKQSRELSRGKPGSRFGQGSMQLPFTGPPHPKEGEQEKKDSS